MEDTGAKRLRIVQEKLRNTKQRTVIEKNAHDYQHVSWWYLYSKQKINNWVPIKNKVKRCWCSLVLSIFSHCCFAKVVPGQKLMLFGKPRCEQVQELLLLNTRPEDDPSPSTLHFTLECVHEDVLMPELVDARQLVSQVGAALSSN